MKADLTEVESLFTLDEGSWPTINFDFRGAPLAATAYAHIQQHASGLAPVGMCYWSKLRETLRPIEFGDNPARHVLTGEAEAFRVVFTGMRSRAGDPIPDLGVFVLAGDLVAVDYRPGPAWTSGAIAGLLDIVSHLASLPANSGTVVTHQGNFIDPRGEILTRAIGRASSAQSGGGRLSPPCAHR